MGRATRGFVCTCTCVLCVRILYTSCTFRYDVVIVSSYVIETKFVCMRTDLAGSVAACAMCLSNKLCTVYKTNRTGCSARSFVSTRLAANAVVNDTVMHRGLSKASTLCVSIILSVQLYLASYVVHVASLCRVARLAMEY